MKEPVGNLSELTDFLEKKWLHASGLAAAALASAALSVTLFTSQDDGLLIRLVVATTAAVVITGVWLYSRRIPKTKLGRIGIAVAISCENDSESRRLRADFITPLQRAVHNGVSGRSLQLLELPQFLAAKLIDRELALAAMKKCRAHLFLYGTVRRRASGSEEFCLFELDGFVAHNPVSIEVRQAFVQEFSELLPKAIKIPAGQEFAGFSFTSDLTEIVAKYIIGIASGLSGDFDCAESMFTEVRGKIKGKSGDFPTFAKLTQRLPLRLAEVYEAKANSAYAEWRKNPTVENLGNFEITVQAMAAPDVVLRPSYHLLSAINQFLNGRDVSAALLSLKKVRNSDGIWHLNVAFLNAYKGNLKSATRNYRLAETKDIDLDAIAQVEEFLCLILDLEPEKYQLHFCLGLFNLHIKGDLERAVRDFEDFIACGDESEFVNERKLAKKWIQEIKERGQNTFSRPSMREAHE